ncbi:MAG: glutaredoxin [Deltaproteobacteria bacterium]|nr:MAG: glutaredoxin [Deltaproteobacteria bacterium]
MPRATLYVQTGCPHCAAARAELAARGVTCTEVNVTEHPEAVPELLKLTKGERVLPVIVEGGRVHVAPRGGARF